MYVFGIANGSFIKPFSKFSKGIFIFFSSKYSCVAFTMASGLPKDFIVNFLSEYSIVSNLPFGIIKVRTKKQRSAGFHFHVLRPLRGDAVRDYGVDVS